MTCYCEGLRVQARADWATCGHCRESPRATERENLVRMQPMRVSGNYLHRVALSSMHMEQASIGFVKQCLTLIICLPMPLVYWMTPVETFGWLYACDIHAIQSHGLTDLIRCSFPGFSVPIQKFPSKLETHQLSHIPKDANGRKAFSTCSCNENGSCK